MDKEIVIENELITIWYYPDKKIIHHKIHKYIFGDEFRYAMLTGLKKLEEEGASKWLSDDTNHAAMPKEDAQWGSEVWTPRALKAGFHHWAIVLPQSAVGKMSHQRMVEVCTSLGINIKLFDNLEIAFKWLEKQ